MPNWCSNFLCITSTNGEDVKAVLEAMKSDDPGAEKDAKILDFDKVAPYPERFEEGDRFAREHREKHNVLRDKHSIKGWEGVSPDVVAEFYELACKYGYNEPESEFKPWWGPRDGYNSGGCDWCRQNWGTRSSAYEVEIEDQSAESVSINFLTAWSPPTPIIVKLSEMFPGFRFEIESEEFGNGLHEREVYFNGELVEAEELPLPALCEECGDEIEEGGQLCANCRENRESEPAEERPQLEKPDRPKFVPAPLVDLD